jgi:NAD(P)-dependent dehydrogenase (short-subunit alcohol dehydrogenase family)
MADADRPLAGRHAIVTGGGRGIGAAIAGALAAQGAAMTLLGRDAARLADEAQRIRELYGGTVLDAVCDVTDEAAVRSAFARAAEHIGAAHILVNNAGQAEGAPFLETTLDLWRRMLDVNLTGAFLCARAALPGMLERGDGRIVNIASTSGLRGFRNVAAYTAAKHGVVGLTRALAAETVRAGVTVNAVCPAYTETEMAERAVATVVRDFGRTEAEARAAITRSIPRGALIRPEEVASAVVWLCSDGASGVTGQALAVAGGEV